MRLCDRCKAPMGKQVYRVTKLPKVTATLMQMANDFPMLIWAGERELIVLGYHYPHTCGGGFV